ncbi:MAG: cupin domain-containing protein [Rhodospirillaceae bacterium]|jgi:mannose-6-phosphate isomerase-like protein (cupin superfamily)|nr:cupin domain-containing protein [Rhodospirillaceae bacterium]MBT4688917.1 cupin domain-containing protein [Rhodospirillaceae bacterium]MBT5084086.1 cupin domain-containing protein [Rhodospirillaceae bacterium]MBT5525136.1 cupin domain-containing protein [Rhodospirillaceae bacterium]MBT5878381.1 cupin domain-containing protein [Rhodospirillaceae bacterium]
MSVEASVGTDSGNDVAIAKIDDPVMVPGRREFLKYRELGVTAASGGRLRAQITSASQGLSEETGWHVHLCEGQFVYMLSGWVDLEFAGGRVERIKAGDSMYIPGGTPHNETATSDAFELLEVSIPADMGTEVCDAPA